MNTYPNLKPYRVYRYLHAALITAPAAYPIPTSHVADRCA